MSDYFILVAALAVIVFFALIATRRRLTQLAAREVSASLSLVLIALIMFGVSLLELDERIRFLFHELKFLTVTSLSPTTLLIYLRFTGASDRFTFTQKSMLYVIPVISVILCLTNDYHHLFRESLYILKSANASYVGVDSGWWFWVYSAYSYAIYLLGIGVLMVHYYRMPHIYRNRIGLLLAAASGVIILSMAALFGMFIDYGDVTLVTSSVVCLTQYLTIVLYSKKRVVLKARNLIVNDIDSYVFIFDHKDKLVDANKDAGWLYEALCPRLKAELDGEELQLPDRRECYSISDKRIYDDKARYTGRVLVLNDITALSATVNELEDITSHDYLTGLPNRHSFQRTLENVSAPAALVCVNISGMKLINSIFGNEYGDRVIIRVAEEISASVRERQNGRCARLSGDEFGIVLQSVEGVEGFIDGLKSRLEHEEQLKIILKTGFVTVDSAEQNAKELFMDAAEAVRYDMSSYTSEFFESLRGYLRLVHSRTGTRSDRIIELCELIAGELELSADERARLGMLAEMADIGLMSVSPDILQNVGNLTNEQWEEMKLHTVRGHSIALSLRELSDIAMEILAHHERFDGYGYPMRLKAEDIPLLARIYSAAEYFVDAPAREGRRLLQARRGTQFDPTVVDAIVKIDNERMLAKTF